MKSILKIYWRYVRAACMLVALLVFINLSVLMGVMLFYMSGGGSGTDTYPVRTGGYEAVAQELARGQDGSYCLSEAGQELLSENGYAFALLLNAQGQVIWEWNRPEEIPQSFSAGEIGAFSKWYLKGYPVGVWRFEEGGLLVFAWPNGAVVRHNMIWEHNTLEGTIRYLGLFFLVNAMLVFVLALLSGYRFYRSLKPVGTGIDALARGESVRLRENGMTQYLKEKINQTSALLERQREQLARRDQARTEWIAGVSHDIRTPLSLIVGYADTMASDPELGAQAREHARCIREQSVTIKKLIEDLNLTSKLTYQAQPLRRDSYAPAAWLRQEAARLIDSGELGERFSLEIELDSGLESLRMVGDVALLTRALRNLLGNSIRHNPSGCEIALLGRACDGGFCVCVRDTGSGVPEAVREVLRGGEAPAELTDQRPHVMGLRLVQQIAAAHGGRLWFEEEGRAVWMSVKDVF